MNRQLSSNSERPQWIKTNFLLLIGFVLLPSIVSAQSSIVSTKEPIISNCAIINSPQVEFSPTFFDQGILYVSSNSQKSSKDVKRGEPFYGLLYAPMDANGELLPAKPFSLELSSKHYEGPACFTATGDKIFYTQSNKQLGYNYSEKRKTSQLKIVEATRSSSGWKDLKELPFNNSNYSVCHPSLSKDGTKLYFASDMPGGYGGMDIWVCERAGELWGQPKNLGPTINTDQKEGFPFIHSSGFLFFASSGHGGFGGYDLFKANLEEPTPKVINLDKPFNSEKDDLGFVLNDAGTSGYFSSDREGGAGRDDIYHFSFAEPTLTATEAGFKIIVTDKESKERIKGAGIYLFELNPSAVLTSNELYEATLVPSKDPSEAVTVKLTRKPIDQLGAPARYTTSDGEASYPFDKLKKYLLLVVKDGYNPYELNYLGDTTQLSNNSLRIELKKIGAPITLPLTLPKCGNLLGKVLSQETNQPLELTLKIIEQQTQREISILSSKSGEFQICLEKGNYRIFTEKQGYLYQPTNFIVDQVEKTLELSLAFALDETATIRNTPIKAGTVIVLDKIYYDYNKTTIRPDATKQLDALIEVMNTYKSMEIELIAHTDTRGTHDYNLQLSLQRAEAAKQYLLNAGINAQRIKAIGAGETAPRNKCKEGIDCTEEEHQYNRRTEVKVTKVDEPIKVEYKNN